MRFFCPSGHALTADVAAGGRTIRCPQCKLPVIVPSPEQIRYARAQRLRRRMFRGMTRLAPSRKVPVMERAGLMIEKPAARNCRPMAEGATASVEPIARQGVSPVSMSAYPSTRFDSRVQRGEDALPAQGDSSRASNTLVGNSAVDSAGDGRSTNRFRGQLCSTRKSARMIERITTKRTQHLKQVAALLAIVALLSAIPVLASVVPALGETPLYARWALAFAAVQAVFAAWSLLVPDWSAASVMMFVFAISAACYGAVAALTTATPVDREVALELTDVRQFARGWCLALMLLHSLGAYFAGRLAATWRRELHAHADDGRSADG